MEVLLYQLFIVATLIVLRIFGSKALLVGAIVWSCLTVVNLFLPPLILVQLVVVWTTYGMLAPKEAGKSAPSLGTAHASARQPALGTPVQTTPRPITRPLIEVPPDASSRVPAPVTPEIARAPLIRDGALAKRKAMLDLELAFANLIIGRAESRVAQTRFLTSADAETLQLYLDERAKRSVLASASDTLAGGRCYNDFVATDEGGLVLAEMVSNQWHLDRKKIEWAHDAALKTIISRLDADEDLRKALHEVAMETGASRLISHLDAKAVRFKSDLFEIKRTLAEYARRRPSAKQSANAVTAISTESKPNTTARQPLQLDGSVVFPPDASAINRMAESRAVPHLVHFTSVQNLESILMHGLQSVSHARANGVTYVANDELRLDRRLHAISTSVAFPNASMFWKYRQSSPASQWAVLLIDRSVLWKQECYFCQHNAADSRMIRMSPEALKRPETFAAMFGELEGLEARDAQNLGTYDPTDPQAEVMVLGIIPPEAITAIVFNDAALAGEYVVLGAGRSIEVNKQNGGYFGQRSFARAGKAWN